MCRIMHTAHKKCHYLTQVILWSADALSSIVELDNEMLITKAEDTLGLMLGTDQRRLLNHSFARWGSHWD